MFYIFLPMPPENGCARKKINCAGKKIGCAGNFQRLRKKKKPSGCPFFGEQPPGLNTCLNLGKFHTFEHALQFGAGSENYSGFFYRCRRYFFGSVFTFAA